MCIGRGYREVRNETGPRHPRMYPEAVEGLLYKGILAESGLSAEAPAAVGAGEEASWQRERIRQGEGEVVGSVGQQLLPEALFDLPQVGCLAGEGDAVDFTQSGEPLAVMTPEVAKDRLIGVHAEELTDDLDGENLSIRKFG